MSGCPTLLGDVLQCLMGYMHPTGSPEARLPAPAMGDQKAWGQGGEHCSTLGDQVPVLTRQKPPPGTGLRCTLPGPAVQ